MSKRPTDADPLDRHYTKDPLADACLAELRRRVHIPGGRTPWVLEPSVGGGAFARAALRTWPEATLVGCDLDPDAAGFDFVHTEIHGDFPTTNFGGTRFDLVIGNPPFTCTNAIPHVRQALKVGRVVGMILPWAPLGGVLAWEAVFRDTPPTYVIPITPRPWPDKIREVAFFVWKSPLFDDVRDCELTKLTPWLRWTNTRAK